MTEHEIEYRGFPVPVGFLSPTMFQSNGLSGFKAGVDAVLDQKSELEPYRWYWGAVADTLWRHNVYNDTVQLSSKGAPEWRGSICSVADLERAVNRNPARYRGLTRDQLPRWARD